jgi:hypothetical protein
LNKGVTFDWHSAVEEINDEFFVWCAVVVHESFFGEKTIDKTLKEKIFDEFF